MKYRLMCWIVNLIFSVAPGVCLAQGLKQDSVLKAASEQYGSPSFLGRFLMGSNYRDVWSTQVSMPVFHLSQQGFTIKELGGGQQTKSLRIVDKNKREWVLRTVDKDAEGAVPEKFRKPFVVNFVQDMISASHPYGALVVGELARANDIIAAKPRLYFVPDDKDFGQYREIFANTVCFLELREPTPDRSETESTGKIMEEIIEENDHLILQETVLKARLLDMLIGDWDRHADQWRWGVIDFGATKYYYAIPRDRDQAFFRATGFVPRTIMLFALKHMNGFKKKSKKLKNLNFKSWQFDKTFLNELDALSWEKTVKDFQNRLSDMAIDSAVQKLPREVYVINGPALKDRLIGRRNTLLENTKKYYQFIAHTVDISGTEEEELFEVKQKDNKLNIAVYRLKEKKERGRKIYDRTFDYDDTKFINLAGLGGNDIFLIDGNASSRIKLNIAGGDGKDMYDLKGKIKTVVNDSLNNGDEIVNNQRAKINFR